MDTKVKTNDEKIDSHLGKITPAKGTKHISVKILLTVFYIFLIFGYIIYLYSQQDISQKRSVAQQSITMMPTVLPSANSEVDTDSDINSITIKPGLYYSDALRININIQEGYIGNEKKRKNLYKKKHWQ
jgi:hypothetical protein